MARINKADWEAVSALLDELLAANAEQRAARLHELQATDPGLAKHVTTLLAEEAAIEAERFLEDGPVDPGEFGTLAGHSIGGYTLERPLGHGGMATVWLARRSDGRYEGRVAIKFLNLALLGRGGAEQLQKEANALAKLAHPNITLLIDAGVAISGQPYLVLEYIDGEPIDRWCDARSLDVEARVRLFLQVLAAISHAHGRLILHRDLKPSNILVTWDGRAKVVDFGIAKLLERDWETARVLTLTALGGSALTPEFAAPEQMQGIDVTIATDQYALGVLLYLLLTGAHPTSIPDSTPVERLQSLAEREPKRLSEVAAHMACDLARARCATPLQLARVLRGDLDNIVAKALKKSPGERYVTVEAFADDLRRYLSHEPVSARPDSRVYRMGKFVRRHRLAVGAASVAVFALIAAIAGTTWQAIEARAQRAEAFKQRDRANSLLARNEAIIDFVDMMLTEELVSGEAVAIQHMLERGEKIVDRAFANRPAQQAELLRVLGGYHTIVSIPQKQMALTERGMKLAERAADTSVQAQLACLHAEGLAYVGQHEAGVRLLDEWIRKPDLEGRVAAGCLQTRATLALAVRDTDTALHAVQEGLRRLRAAGEPEPQLEAFLLGDLAFAQHLAGRNSEADRQYREVMARLRAMGREESYYARRVLVDWAIVRYRMGDYRGGLDMLERSVSMAHRLHGNAPIPPSILANRARGLELLGRHQEALTAYQEAYDAAARMKHPFGQAYALTGRANALRAMGDLAGAQRSLKQAVRFIGAIPEGHPARTRYTMAEAQVEAETGKLSSAHEKLTRVIGVTSASGVGQALAEQYRVRAAVEARRGNLESATSDAERSLEIALKLRGESGHSADVGYAALMLGRVLQQAGEIERARTPLRQAENHLSHTLGSEHETTRLARRLSAEN